MIPLEEAKLYLRVEHDEEDELIQGMLDAAAATVEDYIGMSLTVGDLPAPLRQAIFFALGHYYENRIAVSAMKMEEMPLAFKHLCNPYRCQLFG